MKYVTHWYKFFTRCEELVPIFRGVKFAVRQSPNSKLQINLGETVQLTAARWNCRRWRNTSSVSEMLDELEGQSLEVRRDRSSLASLSEDFISNFALTNKYIEHMGRGEGGGDGQKRNFE